MTDGFGHSARLSPVYWANDLHESVTLYEGAMVVQGDGPAVEMMGSVSFDFLPRPSVRFRAQSPTAHPSAALALAGTQGKVAIRLSPTGEELAAWILTSSRQGGGPLSVSGEVDRFESGAGEGLYELRFNLVNMTNFMGRQWITDEELGWRGRLALVGQGWEVTIDSRSDRDQVMRELSARGGFGFTHVGRLRRTDGAPFSAQDAEGVLQALVHLLYFARGALVGLVLPVGLDFRGKEVWRQWCSVVVDPWRGCLLTWFDDHHADALESLFEAFLTFWQKEPWRGWLRTLVRFRVEGNNGGLLEKKLVMSQAALELLAWAVLVKERGWSDTKVEKLSAAERFRLLLGWADLSCDVPAHLTDLARQNKDGPQLIIDARNNIVHPKGSDEHGVVYEAWNLSQWYLELGILRLLDYDGAYVNRLIEGMSTGTVEPVPWASKPSASAR